MNRLLYIGSVSLGLWGGWWLGYQVNIWVALVLASIGTALGWFVYRRYLSRMLG